MFSRFPPEAMILQTLLHFCNILQISQAGHANGFVRDWYGLLLPWIHGYLIDHLPNAPRPLICSCMFHELHPQAISTWILLYAPHDVQSSACTQ